MRKYFGAAAGAVFLLAFTLAIWQGGKDPFVSPVSSMPSILIDYNMNETEIYVKGLNDYRYTNMTVRVSWEDQSLERFKERAYFIYYNTSMTNFTLNVTVWNKQKEYMFNGSVHVAPPDETPRVLTLHEEKRDRVNTYILHAGNLPWKKIMERVR